MKIPRAFRLGLIFLFCIPEQPVFSGASPYPNVVRLNNAMPVLDESGAMFPSLIKVPDWIPPEKRAHPEAVYYLYWATHYGWYIRLSWSRTLEGPYTEFNSPANRSFTHPRFGVLSLPDKNEAIRFDNGIFIHAHLSSPEVMLDHENQKVIMFFHGPCNHGQKSFVATSPYGLNFNPVHYGGLEGYGVVPQILCSQYMRPFTYGQERYAVAMHGVLCKAPHPGPPYEIPPGSDPKATLWAIGGIPVSGTSPRHAAARVRDGRYLDYFFSRRIENERIEMVTIDMEAGDWRSWSEMGPSVTLIDNSAPWENNDTRDPAIYEEEGSVYLLYSGGKENGIGLALLDGDHPLPPEPLHMKTTPVQLISWGIKDIVHSTTPLRGKRPEESGGFVGYPFSETKPLSPPSEDPSQTFYGGFLSAATGKMTDVKLNNNEDDHLDLRVENTDTLHGCLFFERSSFLSDPATPVTFGKYSVIRLKLDRHPGSLRFLVRNGDDYFVSEITPDQTGELRFRSDDDDGKWAAYDPETSLNFDETRPFVSRNFDNITAVGLMIDVDNGNGRRYWLRLKEFEVKIN